MSLEIRFRELEESVHDIDKTLGAHLATCAESSANMGREIKGLKKVVWWFCTGIIGGQFVLIVALIKVLFRW